MIRNYEQIEQAVKGKGFRFFEAEHDPNFVCERTSDVYTNGFTDWLHLTYVKGGHRLVSTFRLTTKPGLYGKGAVLDGYHSTADGVTGVASIIPGQYRGLWNMMHLHKLMEGISCMKGNPHYAPSLWQAGEVEVARDGNRNLIIEPNLKTTKGRFYGVNGHYMGFDRTPDIFTDDALNNWSIGCVGAPADEWFQIMMILYHCSLRTGTKLTLTLLETADFK